MNKKDGSDQATDSITLDPLPTLWMCVPDKYYDLLDGAGCEDASSAGSCTGGNPVTLATGTKTDHVVDYRNHSPWPIVWDRYYHSLNGEWQFSHMRRVQLDVAAMIERATLQRPDGTFVRFHKVYGYGNDWSPAMGDNQSVLGRFDTAYDGSPPEPIHYHYTNRWGEVERYDLDGRLTHWTDPTGRQLTYLYGTGTLDGLLVRIEDDFGRFLDIDYGPEDSYGRRSVESIDDGTVTVAYDHDVRRQVPRSSYPYTGGRLRHLLTQVTQADAATVEYVYDEDGLYPSVSGRGLLTGIIDANHDRHATYEYLHVMAADQPEQVMRVEHGPGLAEVECSVGPFSTIVSSGSQSATFNTSGVAAGLAKTAGATNKCTTCVGEQYKSVDYDAAGNPLKTIGFNNVVTDRTFDDRGNVLAQVQAAGTSDEREETWTWHADLPVPLAHVEPMETATGPGTRTSTTTWTYTAGGQPLTRTVSVSSSEPDRVWPWTYNGAGQVLTHTDPVTGTTAYTYATDGSGNLLAVENELGHITVLSDHTPQGQPGKLIDDNGLEIRISRDERQRVTQVRRGSPSTHWETTDIIYDPIDKPSRIDFPDGSWIEYTYDEAHRLVRTDTPLGYQVLTLDTHGHATQIETFDVNDVKVQETSQVFHNGRLEQIVDAYNNITWLMYQNDTPLYVSNALSEATVWGYDALKRVVETTNPALLISALAYTPDHRVKAATDFKGNTTHTAYNGFGQRVELASPDTGVTTFTYDAAGRLTVRTDARGATASHDYDDLGRVVEIVFAGPGLAGETQTFTYDTCTHGIGRLCVLEDASGITSYSYDLWGRVVSKTFVPAIDPLITLTVGYSYDTSGRLVQTTYPSGKVLATTHTLDQIDSLTYDGHLVLEDATWRPFDGQVTGWDWGDTAAGTVRLTHDLNGSVTRMVDVDTRDYHRDAIGRLQAVEDPGDPDWDRTFDYAPTGELLEASWGQDLYPWEFLWDDNAGRVARSPGDTTSFVYDATEASSNRHITVGVSATPADRDAVGNVLEDQGDHSYQYSARNRLIVSENTATGLLGEYAYNAQGQMTTFKATQPSVSTQTMLYLHDEQGKLLGTYEVVGSGVAKPQEELIYLDGWRMVTVVKDFHLTPLSLHPVLTDHLFTPRKVLDPGTAVVRWDWEHRDPFGSTAPATTSGFLFDHRFPGQRYNAGTGLLHNGFRDYSPYIGAYLQSDPLGLEAGWNTFAYANGDPLSFIDPLGLVVQVCMQPAFGIAGNPINHHWIKTDTVEAGMGGTRGVVPGNESGDKPGDPVQVTNHRGRHQETGVRCETITGVDEEKVNELLEIDRPLGRWGPTNQCQSFVYGVLREAASGRHIGGGGGGQGR